MLTRTSIVTCKCRYGGTPAAAAAGASPPPPPAALLASRLPMFLHVLSIFGLKRATTKILGVRYFLPLPMAASRSCSAVARSREDWLSGLTGVPSAMAWSRDNAAFRSILCESTVAWLPLPPTAVPWDVPL